MNIANLQSLSVKFLFFLICYFLFISKIFAQDTARIELLRANKLEYDAKKGTDIRILTGDVIFKHDSAVMFCDSAYLYSNKNSLDAFGNVVIRLKDSLYLSGEYLTYDGQTKIAEIHDSVELIDEDVTLLTDKLIYDRQLDFGTYTTGGVIIDSLNELYSKIGEYYPKQKTFYFKKDVELINPKYTINCDTLNYRTDIETSYFIGPTWIRSKENLIYCENGWYDSRNDVSQFNKNAYLKSKSQTLKGDSLYYDRKNAIGKAFDNIYILDSAQNIIITGNIAYYNESIRKTWATDSAVMRQISDNDTLFLHADTLIAVFDTAKTVETLYAYHKARFFKSDLQGLCDSMVYSLADSMIFMNVAPIMWSDSSQIIAKLIKIRMDKKSVRQFYLYDMAFIITKEDSLRFNQIKGDSMIGYFNKGELYKINSYSNSKTLYYVKDEQKALIGVNKAESKNLQIFINKNEVKKIVFFEKPTSTLFPEKDLSADDAKLEHFTWEQARKPQNKDDIFIWK